MCLTQQRIWRSLWLVLIHHIALGKLNIKCSNSMEFIFLFESPSDKVPKNEVTLRKHDAIVLMLDSSAATASVSLLLLMVAVCKFIFA